MFQIFSSVIIDQDTKIETLFAQIYVELCKHGKMAHHFGYITLLPDKTSFQLLVPYDFPF